jgi:hypothetical protein
MVIKLIVALCACVTLCLQDLTLAQKMQRWQNVKLTARIMANPMATFAAAGLAYAAAGAPPGTLRAMRGACMS